MDSNLFTEEVFLRCLSFLYTGTVSLYDNKDQLEEIITAAHLINLPGLVSMCENARTEKVMPFASTLIEWNIDVIKKIFLNKV